MFPELVHKEIVSRIGSEVTNQKELEEEKRRIAKKYDLDGFPKNYDLMKLASRSEREKLSKIIKIKPTRVISGVTVVTVVCKPGPCPGNCIYCPPRSKKAPKSYTGLEPAIQRAIHNQYDPYEQVRNRLEQYKLMGYPEADKIEVKVLGGTFLALDKEYQEKFIRRIFDSLNQKESESLQKAKKINETAKHRCVGLSIETRPDYCFEPHVDQMLRYGATKVEIGVQTVYPEILKSVNREHTIEDVVRANQVARDSGLKVGFHLMPNLPGSTFKKDLQMFKQVFSGPEFRPDYLKIYPTLTMKGTKLYGLWKNGKYKPYQTSELINLLANAKKYIPRYCRIQRLGRDVPSNQIEAGCKKTNLREYVKKRAGELGIECKCIRCREWGFKVRNNSIQETGLIKLLRFDYDSCGGKEIFLSYEDLKNDAILGFLRLRIQNQSHRPEIGNKTAIVRELKVVGSSVPIDSLPKENQWQHRGFGKRLMNEAEKISEELNRKKIVVISAVGTKEYYRNLGYKKEGPYMSKILN